LDIGCADRVLLTRAADRVSQAVGIDPIAEPYRQGNIEVVRGAIPGERVFEDQTFDCIAMLAVLEHVKDRELLARECFRLLRPEGRVIITAPRPVVDRILKVLLLLRLIDGMSLEEHHGFDIRLIPLIFEAAGFRLIRKRSFQLGLNTVFVFEKPAAADAASLGSGLV